MGLKKNQLAGAPELGAPVLHQNSFGLALGAVIVAAACTLAAVGTAFVVATALDQLGVNNPYWRFLFGLAVTLVALLFSPAYYAVKHSNAAHVALVSGDIVKARIETAASRDKSFITFGWAAFALISLGFIDFVLMNNVAVGRTFFLLPLIYDKWWQVTIKFFGVNLIMFVMAEILVLVWGLIVALARLMPGEAGRPVRALAIAYCDLFRGLPAIIVLYLIGFGIPTSGLSDVIVSNVLGLFTDLSKLTPQEYKTAIRVDVMWWCILALTLTYGAYVAEVYRAGIESIHQSQIMAARSLGLSYMQTMRYVVIPQAVRRIIAPLLNDFIGLQKDTALVQVVGVIDAFSQSKIVAASKFNLSAVTIVAILFVLITIPQARLVDKLIDRDNARMRAGG